MARRKYRNTPHSRDGLSSAARLKRSQVANPAITRRMAGHSSREIAEATGNSVGYVWECCREQHERLNELSGKLIEQKRREQGALLEGLLAEYVPRSINGDLDAFGAVIKCMERQAKLFGLDAAVKTDNKNENNNANADVTLYTRQEMADAFKKSRDRLEAARVKAQSNQ